MKVFFDYLTYFSVFWLAVLDLHERDHEPTNDQYKWDWPNSRPHLV